MRKQVILYGLGLGLLILLLKYFEYSYFIKSFSHEVYIGAISIFFTSLGIWAGINWIQKTQSANLEVLTNEEVQKSLEVSNREKDVLIGMAEGLSNQQIADKLFISENTIKTHSSNLFTKLDVQRRTQAVRKARELGLLA